MKMFQCCDCSNYFVSPKVIRESRGEWFGVPSYEDVYKCPFCSDDMGYEFEEIELDEDPRSNEDIVYESTIHSMEDPYESYGKRICS